MKNFLISIATGLSRLSPERLLVLGYLSYTVVGWIVLALPWCRNSEISMLDTLFMTVSAVSTTGLVTADVGTDYNFFGQLTILLLVQASGIGYMTFGSFICLARGRKLSHSQAGVGRVIFAIPEQFHIEKFLKSVVVFTVIIEAAGALLLYLPFKHAGVENAAWAAIFHSISAFCTAGFSLFGNNFEGFAGNYSVNLILGALSYLGAIGFIVFVDLWRFITGKIERITLTSRLILCATFWISVVSILLFFVTEPSIRELPPHERLVAAFFQVMSATTTVGYNTLPMGTVSASGLFLLMLLMLIGASPSGTGGGLKTTTFSALFGAAASAILHRDKVTFWGREIPQARVSVATASFCFYTALLLVGCYLLTLTDQLPFEKLAFEAVSALGTVGLSAGVSSSLTPLGQLIIIFLMFAGRVGPLAFGVALMAPAPAPGPEPGREDLAL